MVVAITVETGHFATAQATDSGSFRATLFAPAGTSIFIKADPVGTIAARFLSETDDDVRKGVLAALPGTILRVADPLDAGMPVGDAGRSHFDALPAWTFQGSLAAHTFALGDPLRVRGTVRVTSPALRREDGLKVSTNLRLKRFSDTDGSSLLRRSIFASTFSPPPDCRLNGNLDGGMSAWAIPRDAVGQNSFHSGRSGGGPDPRPAA